MLDSSVITTPIRYTASGLARFLPEPRSAIASAFRGVVRGVEAALSEPGSEGALNAEYADLINRQIAVQEQMQLVSMESNIEKSRHETQMAAIRNIRAG